MIWVFLIIPFMLAAAKIHVEPDYLDKVRASGNDQEFAKLMGLDVSLVRPIDERSEGSIMNKVSPLGDILLTPEQEEQSRQGLNLNRWPTYRWPNNEVPYVINRGDFNYDQLKTIENTIAEFNCRVSNMKLVPRGQQLDYVYIFSGSGCWSYVGKIGNQQGLSLQQNGCVWPGTVTHELMHAVGFVHEQSRSDRDDNIRILWDNIPSEWQSQYWRFNPNDYDLQGPYDYYSVMHYGIYAPGSGKRAYDVLQNGIDEGRIGTSPSLTYEDAQKINELYS